MASQHRWKPYALAASLMFGQAQGAQDDALTLYVPFRNFGHELLLLMAVGLLVTYLLGIVAGMLLYKAFGASRRVEPLP
eukprot:13061911-Alexandrium_andersonii.AAC.1